METKMITIPFDVELAKEIQAGAKPGKIITRCKNSLLGYGERDELPLYNTCKGREV